MSTSTKSNIATIAWNASVRWWLKDPLNPAANMPISLQPGTMKISTDTPQQVVFPIGRVAPVVMNDVIKMPTITALPLRFLTDASYQGFENLRATGHVLLLQAPQQLGHWYIVLGQNKTDDLDLKSMRQWTQSGYLIRDVTITAQVVAAP